MKESIHIKNFGPVKDVLIDDIKPVTVFIGESGSGKSTIMKVISLFRWIYKMHNIRSYLKRSKVSKSPFRFRMDTYLKSCGFEQYVKNNSEIIYTVEVNGQNYIFRFYRNKLSGTTDSHLVQLSDLQYNKISYISETRNIIPLWANRGASLVGAYLGFYFHEVYNDFDAASEQLKDINIDYLGLKLHVRKNQSGKRYTIQSDDKEYEIDLRNSSSGTQNAIPVTLISEYFSKHFDFEDAFNRSLLSFLSKTDNLTGFKPVKNLGDIKKQIFIHIEEPELSLFPDAQCDMMSDVIYKCFVTNKNSIRLMFSTHSPYIINHLNLLIKTRDCGKYSERASIDFDDLIVYLVENGSISSLMVQNERLVNTNVLSETINEIYDKYNTL